MGVKGVEAELEQNSENLESGEFLTTEDIVRDKVGEEDGWAMYATSTGSNQDFRARNLKTSEYFDEIIVRKQPEGMFFEYEVVHQRKTDITGEMEVQDSYSTVSHSAAYNQVLGLLEEH